MTTTNQGFNYNAKYFHEGVLYQLSPKAAAFRTFVLSNGIIFGLFQGSRGSRPDIDFVVKILRPGPNERAEPPMHAYWVVDLMIKSHHFPEQINEILDYYIDFYDNCTPFESVDERNNYQPRTLEHIMTHYGTLSVHHTLPMDYIALIIEFFSLCEKRNSGAYMFRELLHILKDYVAGNADYMNVIKASMPKQRR